MEQSLIDKKIKTFLDKHYLKSSLKERCPEDETLLDFAEGNISDTQRNTIISHLNRCKKCNEIIKLYTRISDEGYENVEVPEYLSKRVMENIFKYGTCKIKKMIVKLIDRGFEIIQAFKGLNYELVPAPVYRDSTEKEEMLVINMLEKEYNIKGKLVHQTQDKVSIELNVLKKGYPLSDIIITLYRIKDNAENVLESQNSNIDGTIIFDNIIPGNYSIEIEGKEPVKFHLELQRF